MSSKAASLAKKMANLEKKVSNIQLEKRNPTVPKVKPKRKRRMRKAVMAQSVGQTTARNSEYLYTIKIPANKTEFGFAIPLTFTSGETQFSAPILAKIANIYETYKVKSMSFSYHTQTGTNTGGMVVIGIEGNGTAKPPASAAKVFPLASKTTSPIFRNSQRVKVPKTLVDPNLVRYTRGVTSSDVPISLVGHATIGSTSTSEVTIGYIMVQYDIEFNGILP